MNTHDAADTLHTETEIAIPEPADATELFEWQRQAGLATREFVGTVRDAGGFTIRVEGIQRENGTCVRRISIERGATDPGLLGTEVARQFAAAVIAAAQEIDFAR